MTTITIDIETIGSECPAVRDEIAASILPPGNMKKAETIAKWEQEEKPALVDEAVKKTSFDGGYGRIVVFGIAINDEKPKAITGDEKDVLLQAFDRIRDAASTHTRPLFVGHNLIGFDLRFIIQRAMVLGVKPPMCLPRNPKPWDDSVGDTMLMWAGHGNRISLKKLCSVLGIACPKDDLDGSKVWDYVKAGRVLEVAEYCKGDIEATRAIYKRLTFAA